MNDVSDSFLAKGLQQDQSCSYILVSALHRDRQIKLIQSDDAGIEQAGAPNTMRSV